MPGARSQGIRREGCGERVVAQGHEQCEPVQADAMRVAKGSSQHAFLVASA